MNYRTDDNLSILGFGCMRFAKKGPSFDEEEIERELLHAIDMGINYYDMASSIPESRMFSGASWKNAASATRSRSRPSCRIT